jgi:hypothetical protein
VPRASEMEFEFSLNAKMEVLAPRRLELSKSIVAEEFQIEI